MQKKKNNSIRLVSVKTLPARIFYNKTTKLLELVKKTNGRHIRLEGVTKNQAYILKNRMKKEKLKMTVTIINKQPYVVKSL